MRSLSRVLLVLAAGSLSLFVFGCGGGVSTGVYVGVAVPGPYYGYPGVGGYMGPPPVVYYDDDDYATLQPLEEDVRYGVSIAEEPGHQECPSPPQGSTTCAAERSRAARPTKDEVADQANIE
jgi:hypothetical protein